MGQQRSIIIKSDPAAVATAGAEAFVAAANSAIASTGRFTVALSGGSTPKALFALLADPNQPYRNQLSWDRLYIFWGDERHVPPDDPNSNYLMAYTNLLSKVPIPEANIHRIQAENGDSTAAAADYQSDIQTFFHAAPGTFPAFDLILLGMGPDGHTASLFPNTTALTETTKLVTSTWVEKLHTDRITFTYPLINAAKAVLFLVTGADKAPVVKTILTSDAPQYPASNIRPTTGTLTWILDTAAAG